MKNNKIILFGYLFWLACMILFLMFFKEEDLNLHENFSNEITNEIPYVSTIEAKLNNKIQIASLNLKTIELEPQSFYPLTDYERWLVESIVAGESGIEPYWGKVAVASCILNACLLEDKRPEEIQTMYGYAGWKPIEEFESECIEAYGNTYFADEVREAVSQVFDNGEVFSNEILWFCSGYSEWHESQRLVVEISNHRFFAPWN